MLWWLSELFIACVCYCMHAFCSYMWTWYCEMLYEFIFILHDLNSVTFITRPWHIYIDIMFSYFAKLKLNIYHNESCKPFQYMWKYWIYMKPFKFHPTRNYHHDDKYHGFISTSGHYLCGLFRISHENIFEENWLTMLQIPHMNYVEVVLGLKIWDLIIFLPSRCFCLHVE